MVSSKTVAAPSKILSWEDFYKVTENADKLMDRVWYCIACTDKNAAAEQKVFWEHWFWKNEEEQAKELSATATKEGSNHTLTISASGNKEVDYPIWPLTFTKSSYKMFPAIDLKCVVIAPIGLNMQPVTFPTKDSRTEFRKSPPRVSYYRINF